MFFSIMAFLKILFLIMDIQVLEVIFWTIRCEDEVIINLPPQTYEQIEWVS